MTHMHLTAIILTIILFIVTYFLQKSGKNTKVLHMILRVLYILILTDFQKNSPSSMNLKGVAQ